MLRIIFDAVTRRGIGHIDGEATFSGAGFCIDAATLPPSIDLGDIASMSLEPDGVTVVQDRGAFLNQVKLARIARVKGEAATMVAALDWKLNRARERETAGWGTLADIDAVLAEREAIRQSSDAAEQAIMQMSDVSTVLSASWSITVSVKPPRRLTHTQFLARFTDAEAAAVLVASEASPALKLFWQKMTMADWINLDDPATQAGINALEIAGLLAHGRGGAVLA